jgi:hypothetical protein
MKQLYNHFASKAILRLVLICFCFCLGASGNYSLAQDCPLSSSNFPNNSTGAYTLPPCPTGSYVVLNKTELIIPPGLTLIIEDNVIFEKNSTVKLEQGASLIIKGNLTNAEGSKKITIDGYLEVKGNLVNSNTAAIEGTGSIYTTGSMTGPGKYFGNHTGECGPGPCTSSNLLPTPTPVFLEPLPIELKFFSATLVGQHVEFAWATLSESNNNYFSIERSEDGVTFTTIMRIAGAGNSAEELSYQASDPYPLSGRSYYRLLQTDYDGTTSASAVQTVFVHSGNNIVCSVYPNPVSSGPVRVYIAGQKGEQASIVLADMTGKVIISQQHYIAEQSHEIELIESRSVKPGIYIIIYTSASVVKRQTVIIN